MKTPYEILSVSEHASDADIKQAYLQKVKQYPPDHHHDLFQQIHSAYQTLKDQKSRLNYALFNYPEADFNALLDQGLARSNTLSLSADNFEKLLRASIDERIFQFSTSNKSLNA
jgi:DnaJ-class molecular chaperone